MHDDVTTIRPFLTAEWLDLIMLSYEVEPHVLEPHVPDGTELDFFNDRCFASIVGFRFDNTRLFGRLPILGCRNFPEVNLRFYVKRRVGDHWRRGVVFIKELAPRRLVCRVARWLYHENYYFTPVRHERRGCPSQRGRACCFRSEWPQMKGKARLSATTCGPLRPLHSGTVEEFIAEHYWAYSAAPNGRTLEYHVVHPPWQIWHVEHSQFDAHTKELYGNDFVKALRQAPQSALVAAGSSVTLERGRMLPLDAEQ